MTTASPGSEARRRTVRRLLTIGAALLLPRFALVWLVLPPGLDLLPIVATFVMIAGLFLIGAALIRLQLLRGGRLLFTGMQGLALILIAFGVLSLRPAGQDAAVVYTGGLVAPLPVVLIGYLYLLVGAASQLGLVLLVGSIGAAVGRRLNRTA